jgi:DNA-binding NarL/FixJ family response regulator
MRRLKLLVAEDHPLMVAAIRIAFARRRDFEIVAVVESGDAVVEAALRLDPDVVLLDLRLPGIDGLEVLRALGRANVRAKRVVLSASDGSDVVQAALRAGASAFITKRIDPYDLAAALRQAVDQTLFQPFHANPLLQERRPGTDELTERERAVLTGVAAGRSNKEIAQLLSYAEQTVKLDLSRIYRKLGVSSRTGAIAVAFSRGLMESPEPAS